MIGIGLKIYCVLCLPTGGPTEMHTYSINIFKIPFWYIKLRECPFNTGGEVIKSSGLMFFSPQISTFQYFLPEI